MEWRCEWCEKPHESNDPPCDNCGHGSFERAIVRQTAPDSDPDTTTLWVCTDCGREHTRNNPPCSRCRNSTLERREVRIDDSNLTAAPVGARDVGPAFEAEATTIWVCPECNREHASHSPPCTDCSHPTLEAQEVRVADSELAVPSYFDLVTPRYALAFLGVFLIASIFVLGLAGVVDVPLFPDDGVPEVEAVPGNESAANGVTLADVEEAYVAALNREREEAGAPALSRSDDLDEIATYYNQKRVKQALASGDPPERDVVEEVLADVCDEVYSRASVQILRLDSEDPVELGNRLLDELVASDSWQVRHEVERVGVDVHSGADRLFLTHFECV